MVQTRWRARSPRGRRWTGPAGRPAAREQREGEEGKEHGEPGESNRERHASSLICPVTWNVLQWKQKPLDCYFVSLYLFTVQQRAALCVRAESDMQAGSATLATGSGLFPIRIMGWCRSRAKECVKCGVEPAHSQPALVWCDIYHTVSAGLHSAERRPLLFSSHIMKFLKSSFQCGKTGVTPEMLAWSLNKKLFKVLKEDVCLL